MVMAKGLDASLTPFTFQSDLMLFTILTIAVYPGSRRGIYQGNGHNLSCLREVVYIDYPSTRFTSVAWVFISQRFPYYYL